MAPLPVIADTYRVTLNWSNYNGVTPRNVFHVRAASSSEPEVAVTIGPLFGDSMFQAMSSGQVLTSITVIALDGISASYEYPLPTEVGGGASGDTIPASAAIVKLGTDTRGPRGRGRVFLGPVCESAQSSGFLNDDPQSTMQTAWMAFVTAMADATPAMSLVVASYVHADENLVTALRVEGLVGTQRRRQEQLRR